MVALWIVIIVVTFALFITAHSVILPKIFLKVRYNAVTLQGNGVKAVKDSEGSKILYRTDLTIRKYICGYVLLEKEKKKQIICKVGDGVKFVDYDIVCFDNFNRVIDVITVNELIGNSTYTKALDIPMETAYAILNLNRADGKKFKKKSNSDISNLRLTLHLLCCLAVEVLTVFILRLCFAKLFGGLYGESFLYSGDSLIIALITCLAVFVINVVVTVLTVKLKNRKSRG